MLTFVDANVFIRLFVELDNESQAGQAEKLFVKAHIDTPTKHWTKEIS